MVFTIQASKEFARKELVSIKFNFIHRMDLPKSLSRTKTTFKSLPRTETTSAKEREKAEETCNPFLSPSQRRSLSGGF